MSEASLARLRLWHPRGRLCALCRRPARGLAWSPPAAPKARLRWFCSRACQDFWWRRVQREGAMVDLTDLERAAIRAAVKPVAEILEEIGWTTRLADLTEPQVLTLIEAAVGGFQDALHRVAVTQCRDAGPEVPF